MSSTSSLTFACTVLHAPDGRTFQAGDVIRVTGHDHAWADCIILGFSDPTKYGDVFVKLARPYCYASCVGTTSPGVLVGTEEFAIEASKLRNERILTSRPMVSGSVAPVDRGYDSEIIDLRPQGKVA